MIYCSFSDVMSLIPEDTDYTLGSMAESTGVKPYHFEQMIAMSYIDDTSDSEESNSDNNSKYEFNQQSTLL